MGEAEDESGQKRKMNREKATGCQGGRTVRRERGEEEEGGRDDEMREEGEG